MTKIEFLNELSSALENLSEADRQSSVQYYSEMIDDRIENGMDEETAVAELPSVKAAAESIMLDLPLTTIIKNRLTRKTAWRVGEIVLLIIGSPLWISVLLTIIACALSVYVTLWSVMASLWAVDIAFAGAAVGLTVSAVAVFFELGIWSAVANFGGALLCLGLFGFMFYGCIKLTALFVKASIKFTKFIKAIIIGKENKDEKID